MDAHRYRTLARRFGPLLAACWDAPFPLDALPRTTRAVYVAVDEVGRVRYVGSLDRAGPLRRRIAEHRRLRPSYHHWDRLWVFPVKPCPTSAVRQLEGMVGAQLFPTDNERLPRPGLASAIGPSQRQPVAA